MEADFIGGKSTAIMTAYLKLWKLIWHYMYDEIDLNLRQQG